MKRYDLAVIAGDGVGKEVMQEAVKVLSAISDLTGNIDFKLNFYDYGCEYYLKTGVMMEKDGLKKLEQHDAILLGAVGYPNVPDHISLRDLLLKIRQGFNQYVNLRPIKLLPHVNGPLAGKGPDEIDMVFIRENTEGEYAGSGGIQSVGGVDTLAVQTSIFTRETTKKTMEYAFEYSRKRNKEKKLTSITKSNALNHSMVFWDSLFKEIASGYADIRTEELHVDAASMFLVQKPERFDVVVASNLFGDIMTDVGAALQGGLGFAAGANLNPEKKFPSMFEPVHGSAPDIAGKGIANPIAMIWSIKMMLDFLGHEDIGEALLNSIVYALKDKAKLTPDLGGKGTTSSVGDIICRGLVKKL
ncbi:tartrate dehydrogenase [Gudongella oleilytica]|jgi:tartrate dehydrogenase/decarboxylase/D-malate dehydrogenase|uniref:tartrate dehydrogenase n=1 Tax=Gudongella oleilytica TaxID=1582259 RepID=UPI000FF897C7|nr:tartrate dehydrogenase [Gudongella oleilytica]